MAEETAVAAVVADPKADELRDLHARFDALETLLKERLAPPSLAAVTPAPGEDVIVQSKGPCAAWRAWFAAKEATFKAGRAAKCLYRMLDGIKALLVFGVTGGLALVQSLDMYDLTPYLEMILPEGSHVSASQAIVLMSVTGIGLRLITKTPVFTKWIGQKIGGGSDSTVDEPTA